MTTFFIPPVTTVTSSTHHAEAAAGNIEATSDAIEALKSTLSGDSAFERILLKAAAGAGKSYALKRMVETVLTHPACDRVVVIAFANKQIFPLAEDLGGLLGKERVCLFVAESRFDDVPDTTKRASSVVTKVGEIPVDIEVLVATSHKVGGWGRRPLQNHLGAAANGDRLFDVLFVDEAWQLPLHRYREIEPLAPIAVGVGDVGQLPPLDPGENPWRGDPGYNPYRAWPTEYERDERTWSTELPAVWRPTAGQLALWRAFYGDWEDLNCVAGPGDRSIDIDGVDELEDDAAVVWGEVASGRPTLVEVAGLPDADAADVDLPLLLVVEGWLDQLLTAGFTLRDRVFDDAGQPTKRVKVSSRKPDGRKMIAVLATRNQAVDDATEMVDRLIEKHSLPEGMLIASTVDSWQGQTNAITVAVHPLSGASALDDFNSAFGRLAVTCTRATHGLLMVSRSGLTDLLANAPARPGTPLGEPGARQLPRQTHLRILDTFSRASLIVDP